MGPKLFGLFKITAAITTVIITAQCARMVAPSGGEKDEDPPVALRSKPVNYSTHFKGSKFQILFDEFIVLKNINQELLVSPPLPEKPEIRQRGKWLIVKINNELKDSTTYNFNFYNAITDLNEGNELKDFQFEFSTGPEFDSIYLAGYVQDAFNYKTTDGLLVMLYNDLNDSTPRKMLPEHLGKTDKGGHFFVPNMRKQPYYIFALKDMNNNLKFDLPNESIAFSDSTFEPAFTEIELTDTFRVISQISKDKQDTVYRDSLVSHKEIITTIGNIRLFMFTEDYAQQYFKDWYRNERQQVILAFNRKLTDSISVHPLIDKPFRDDWMLLESPPQSDSMVFWITDTSLFKADSLKLQINYTAKDSNQNNYIRTDTLMVVYKEKEKSTTPKKEKATKRLGNMFNKLLNDEQEEEKTDSVAPPSELKLTHNVKNTFDLNQPIVIQTRFPIAQVRPELITFAKIDEKDTITIKFNFSKSDKKLREFLLYFKPEEKTKYTVLIPAGCFIDIYNQLNDSLKIDFTTQPYDYYGKIKMNLVHVKPNAVVQLLDEKETLVEERKINMDTTLIYDYLPPKKFIFKLFYDQNNNGVWDTGNFKERRQPEQVYYFEDPITTKSNWDMEFTWSLDKLIFKKDEKKQNTKN